MEYYGELINLSDPKVKIKQLLQRLLAKDNEIQDLKSQIEEKKKSLEELEERYRSLKNKGKPKSKVKVVKAKPKKTGKKTKRVIPPEEMEKKRQNLEKARIAKKNKTDNTLLSEL